MHPVHRTFRIPLGKLGTWASTLCAVHCVLTGLAFGLLSFAGLGALGSVAADLTFLFVAVALGAVSLIHGARKHHSVKPALIFVLGLAMIVLGHFGYAHEHAPGVSSGLDRVLSTLFSVAGGACLVAFNVVNQRLAHQCGCEHCATGQ